MRNPYRVKSPPRLPKVCGADFELGNFVLGINDFTGSGREASRALLAAIEGYPRGEFYRCAAPTTTWQSAVYGGRQCHGNRQYHHATQSTDHAQDWGRRFLAGNGGCVYIDLDHLELCIPEVSNAWDHVAATHAMLRVAREALHVANAEQPVGRRIQVLVNNSDGQGNAYGAHLNFLITRRAFDNIFNRRGHYLQYLASFQASSLVFTGQGKVGAENGAPHAPFQLSQRADFVECLAAYQTTFNRPLLNTRSEHLSGARGDSARDEAPARLHCIFYDSSLAHGSCLLKVGTMQIILAMLEAERCDFTLLLEDPVDAVVQISHDPTLKACVELTSGERLTAVELQERFIADARRFEGDGGFEGVVPRASEILDLWEDTIAKLMSSDLLQLAPRLDWVMKLMSLEQALDQRSDLTWESPEIKVLDQLYASLDDDGLYWAYETSGFAERFVSDARITHLTTNPPDDTRAWMRAMLLRLAGPESIDSVDWDAIGFRLHRRNYWPVCRKVSLGDPLTFTRAEGEALVLGARSLEGLLDAIDAIFAEGNSPSTTDTTDKQMESIN